MRPLRFAILALALVLAACQSKHERVVVIDPAAAPAADNAAMQQISSAMVAGLSSYKISPGDQLDVGYFFDTSRAESYTLGVGDTMTVDFRTHPEYTRHVVVRPDGRISMPGIGAVRAVGRTPEQLGSAVAAAYNDILVNPQVTVIVESFNSRSQDLMRMVSASDQRRALTAMVEPDGKINLPLLSPIQAAGKPVSEVTASVNSAYAQMVSNVKTTIRLQQLAPNSIFVFGEVKQPGPVNTTGPRTVLQLIAAAGGPTPQAATAQTRIIYYDETMQAVVRVVNVEALLRGASGADNIVLPPNATIYVPPTGLANLGRALDTMMGSVLRFNGVGASYSITR